MKKLLFALTIILGMSISGCCQKAETTECTKGTECSHKHNHDHSGACPGHQTPACCDQSKVVDLVYQVQIKPEFKDEIIKIFDTMVSETRKEKGCIMYDLYQNQEDPNNLILIEKWATQEDLDNHSNSDHFKQYIESSDGKYEKAEGKKVKLVY